MTPSLKNSFYFEYGPLDDGTYWIQTLAKKLINVSKDSLDVILKLNNGDSLEEISRICGVNEEEIRELIARMKEGGGLVKEDQGGIKQAKAINDIRVCPYVLLWILLALIQIWYFKNIARTYLMEKWQEGVIVLMIAVIFTMGHEFGHYIVSKKYFKPKFGFTFLFIFPAFYVNTQEAWKLPKGIRILINLAGSLLDLLINTFVICLVIFLPRLEYYATPFIMTQFCRWALVLNPLFPTDFYWILCDVTKIVNLSQKAKENLWKLRPNFLSLYALLAYICIILSLYWFGLYIISILANIINAMK